MVLALVAINQPFTIWLMRSFFLDVPIELDEAACIDGCNLWQTFTKVALPVVRPGSLGDRRCSACCWPTTSSCSRWC